MKRTSSPLMAAGLAMSITLVLAACDRRDDEAANVDNPPPAATQPAPVDMPDVNTVDPNAAVTITSVEMGNQVGADNRVAAPMSTFATSDTVHASVVTDGRGGNVSTRWTFEDGQVVHTEDKNVPSGTQVTDFMITNPTGWPAGTYTMEVLVNGQVVETRNYEVR